MEPQKEIQQLTKELEHAGFLYYVKDAPEMSDYDYDHKLRRLEELEAQYPEYALPNSPTRRVGGAALRLRKGGAVTGERRKGRELRRAVGHRHLRPCFGNVVREMDDIAVV